MNLPNTMQGAQEPVFVWNCVRAEPQGGRGARKMSRNRAWKGSGSAWRGGRRGG